MDTEALLNERKKTHGSFKDHATTTQMLKNILHGHPHWVALTPTQKESLDMIVHKIGRIMAGDPSFQDHWDDIAGYAKLVPMYNDKKFNDRKSTITTFD